MSSPAIFVSELLGTDEETSLNIFSCRFFNFIGFFILVLFISFRKSSKKTVYILGPSDAGKTTLLSTLVTKGEASPITVTSQTANIYDNYNTLKNKIFRLIDIPGADKVRSSVLAFNLARFPAAALIFVVDSCSVVKDSREAAEWLYVALADAFGGKPPPLLIVCAKQGLPGAKAARAVRSALEREFIALHRTRRAAPVNTGTNGSSGKRLLDNADDGRPFDFDRLPNGCLFVECDDADVGQVDRWLDELK